jgi:hypothetical protein
VFAEWFYSELHQELTAMCHLSPTFPPDNPYALNKYRILCMTKQKPRSVFIWGCPRDSFLQERVFDDILAFVFKKFSVFSSVLDLQECRFFWLMVATNVIFIKFQRHVSSRAVLYEPEVAASNPQS